MDHYQIDRIWKSLIGGYATALVILTLCAFALDQCKPAAVVTTNTVTVHDTIPTIVENQIQVSNSFDTTFEISPYGILQLHIHDKKLSFLFTGRNIVDTVKHTETTTSQAAIRQMQKTLRDSADNIRRKYADSLDAMVAYAKILEKQVHDTSSAHVDIAKEQTKQIVATSHSGFWDRVKNDWLLLCIGMAIGAVGIKLLPLGLKLLA